jgi:hypothetical protein
MRDCSRTYSLALRARRSTTAEAHHKARPVGRRNSDSGAGRVVGEHAEAELLAREAVAIGEETHLLNGQGNANADLAEVLLLTGKPDEAAAALEQALKHYERKGNRVSTQRAQTRLAELQNAAPR